MARPRKPSLRGGPFASTSTTTTPTTALSRPIEKDYENQPSKEIAITADTSKEEKEEEEEEDGNNDNSSEKPYQLAEIISEERRRSFELMRVPPKMYRPVVLFLGGYLVQELSVFLAKPYLERNFNGVTHFPEGPWVYLVPAWKFIESLAVYYGGFDVLEAILLTLCSRAPTLLFLSTFHPSISPITLLTAFLVAALSNALPLYFVRSSLSPQHQCSHDLHHHHKCSSSLVDNQTYIATILLSSSIYASIIYTTLKTFLTKYIIVHSSYPETHVLESVVKVYNTDPITWAAHILPVGIAITDVIFARAMTERATKPKKVEGEYLVARAWNGLSPRTKNAVKRTAFVAAYMLIESIVKLGGVVKGGTLEGSAVVGSIWAVAAIVNGLVLGWIGME